MSIPATVNTIGAVTIVCSSLRETRLNRNKRETKTARGVVASQLVFINYVLAKQ